MEFSAVLGEWEAQVHENVFGNRNLFYKNCHGVAPPASGTHSAGIEATAVSKIPEAGLLVLPGA